MHICGAVISCGIRQIYGFSDGVNEPSQIEFDNLMKSYKHGSTWTLASLTITQTGAINFLKRNGFVQFDETKRNRRTPGGNFIVLLIRSEHDGIRMAEQKIDNYYKKMRQLNGL